MCARAVLGCVRVCSLHVRHDSVVWVCSVMSDVASSSVWHDSCMYVACVPVCSIFRAFFLACCRCVVYSWILCVLAGVCFCRCVFLQVCSILVDLSECTLLVDLSECSLLVDLSTSSSWV